MGDAKWGGGRPGVQSGVARHGSAQAQPRPQRFLVNFGRVVGNGAFAVAFRTVGVQSVSTAINLNLGSPAVEGQFLSPANESNIVVR